MDTPDDTFVHDQGLLVPSPASPMRLDGQSGPRPTGQSFRQLVATTELDGERGKTMLPASPGLALPHLQGAPDPRHRDNPTSSAVLLHRHLPRISFQHGY